MPVTAAGRAWSVPVQHVAGAVIGQLHVILVRQIGVLAHARRP
jgi:hypothetical protein